MARRATRKPERPYLLGVDVGGSKIAFAARAVGGRRDVLAGKVKIACADVSDVLAVLDAAVGRLPGGRASLAALGVGVAGLVEPPGRVVRAGNLEGWENVPLRDRLEKRYGVPAFVERDANCGALGEKWCGAARRMEDFVFLSLGTGVGAGLFLDGRLRRGAHAAAGEAGDLAFPFAGTAGDVLSKRAVKKVARRATREEMSAADALARADREPRLERATREVVASLASVVIALAALVDPEAILLGGGTSRAGDALLRRVRREIPRPLRRTRLVQAGLGARSPVYGALWGAEQARRRAAGLPPGAEWVAAAP